MSRNPNRSSIFGSEYLADGTSGISATTRTPTFYEGIVVDIILNESRTGDDGYAPNGFNIGAAKIRPLNNPLLNTVDSDDKLHWIEPLDMRFGDYPLLGEMVLVYIIAETPFYTRPLPIGKKPTENAYLNTATVLKNSYATDAPDAPPKPSGQHKFGEYFKPLKNAHFLRPFEGDVIIQGRFGNTVRFGSSQIGPENTGLNPNILIRVGEPPKKPKVKEVNNPHGLIYEDVNLDASSLYIVSDQRIPLEPATKIGSCHLRSANEATGELFIGSQILLNSDKIIINSKRAQTFLFSAEGIHGNALKDITFDTDQNFKVSTNIDTKFLIGKNLSINAREDAYITIGRNTVITSKTRMALHANKIFVGSRDEDKEPMVGGTSLSKFLARLIMALVNTALPEPPAAFTVGPNEAFHVLGPRLSPGVVSALAKLYMELVKPNSGQDAPKPFAGAPFNSKDNFVSLDNKDPEIESVQQPMSPEQRESLETYKAEIETQITLLGPDNPGVSTAQEELSFVQNQLDNDEVAADDPPPTPTPTDIEGICKNIVDAAKRDIGLRELSLPDVVNKTPPIRQPFNSNRHPTIDAMHSACGLDNAGAFNTTGTGYHWCAAAVTKWWRAAGAQTPPGTITTPQGRKIQGGPASCQHWYLWAKTFGYLSDTPVVGAAILYYGAKDKRYHHIGIVSSVSPLRTIEGNTSDPSGGFNRNGVGCFEKAPRTLGRGVVYVLPVQGNKITPCALKQLGRTE